jgi:hypothetical protein
MEIHKEILDEFSLVIGLTINFHKRTLFPMHIAVEITNAMAQTLGCPFSSPSHTLVCLFHHINVRHETSNLSSPNLTNTL